MKYIHGDPPHLAHDVEEIGTGVVLDCGHTVDYGDASLIVDPTDGQVFAVATGTPIPGRGQIILWLDPDQVDELIAALEHVGTEVDVTLAMCRFADALADVLKEARNA